MTDNGSLHSNGRTGDITFQQFLHENKDLYNKNEENDTNGSKRASKGRRDAVAKNKFPKCIQSNRTVSREPSPDGFQWDDFNSNSPTQDEMRREELAQYNDEWENSIKDSDFYAWWNAENDENPQYVKENNMNEEDNDMEDDTDNFQYNNSKN
ncbi:hypothetical protein SNEBB_008327 [Seison nebaliae]|nr:hypothetical protein SNEBB_008327 [Seison nebaliae]